MKKTLKKKEISPKIIKKDKNKKILTEQELTFHEKIARTKESYEKIKLPMTEFDKKIKELYEKHPEKFKRPEFRYYSNKNKELVFQQKNAYITSIFISEEYLPAALVLAESLKKVKSKYPIICMVQDKPYKVNQNKTFEGISEKGIQNLLELFDMVIGIDLLKVKNYKKINDLIHFTESSTYKNILYYVTKGQMLSLTQFDKLFYMDASNYVGKNIDYLFGKYSKPTIQFDREWKETGVGYRGTIVFIIPSLIYYYKLLSYIHDYNKFFHNYYFIRGIDELLIFYAIYPNWNKDKIPYKISCIKRKDRPVCDIRHFQVVKPFRPKPSNEYYQNIPNDIFFEWNEHVKNIIKHNPSLNIYYKNISNFRNQKIF